MRRELPPKSRGAARLFAARSLAAVGVVLGLDWLVGSAATLIDPAGAGVDPGVSPGGVAVVWLVGITAAGVTALVVATGGWLMYLRTGDRRWTRRGLVAVPFVAVFGAAWLLTGLAYGGS